MLARHDSLIRVWGKLGQNTYPNHYQPLLHHMIDVGLSGQLIWDRTPAGVHCELANSLGLSTSDLRAWLGFWIAAHDIGKAIPGFQFQGKTEVLQEELRALGYNPSCSRPPFHADASVPILSAWLMKRNVPEKFVQRIAYAVGGHHGLFATSLPSSEHELGNQPWRELQTELLDELARLFQVPKTAPAGGLGEDQSAYLFLAGLTTAADWIGSNLDWFPWCTQSSSNYFEESSHRAAAALDAIKWSMPHTGTLTGDQFSEVFKYALGNHSPRPLQLACEEIANKLTGPSLVLVEAPMGEGKTEAALYIAEWWRRKTGAGAYIALPTMATSNGMFTRVREFLESTVPGWTQLHLLHGQAILSDNYQELKNFAIYDQDEKTGGVMAHGWFAAQKKQAILAPYGVGTIDQTLLAVLQTKHYFLRLFGLAGKTIILDEVHAYDTYMSTLLELLLKWLAALRCPVVLLSATLPQERRQKLIRAYAGEKAVEQGEKCGYPRISWTASDGNMYSRWVEPDTTRTVTVTLKKIGEETLAERLKVALAGGGCACVIRNTVGKAQETFSELNDAFEGTDIKLRLFHARFLFGRRDEIEKEVLKFFGKEGPRPHKMVLVATQVVEQSLDLDFDVMATDIAPVDLILQRTGRLHRHAGRTRPKGLTTPSLWLIEPGEKDGQPNFGHSQFIYERYVLLRTWEVFHKKQELRLPHEIEGLIEAVYAERAETEANLVEAKTKMKKEISSQKFKVKQVIITEPWNEDEILSEGNKEFSEDDDPRTHNSRRAATRDIEPSVQIVIAYCHEGKNYLDCKCEQMLVLKTPDRNATQAILKNSVTVTNYECVKFYAQKDGVLGWQKSGLLKFYRLVQVNLDGSSLDKEFPITVNDVLGVVFHRDPEEA